MSPCRSHNVGPRGTYHYQPGLKRYRCKEKDCKRTFDDLTGTRSDGSYRLITGYEHDSVNHTKQEYARGEVHENRAECLFSLLKPYLRVFRGISKTNLPGYAGFFQFLRNFYHLTAFEQVEMILYAALDPAIAGRSRQGDFVRCLDQLQEEGVLSLMCESAHGSDRGPPGRVCDSLGADTPMGGVRADSVALLDRAIT